MTTKIITLTTDFGVDSHYVAQMKAAVLSIQADVTLVDITHSVPPQDVRYGAWVLGEACPVFPSGTIHIAVVDPGVGTSRPILALRTNNFIYIAPDNGLLTRVASQDSIREFVSLENTTFYGKNVSSTFHGRDIMAPVAAHLSGGLALSELGPAKQDLVRLTWTEPTCDAQSIHGEVVAIDHFGNLITNIDRSHLEGIPDFNQATVCCGSATCEVIHTTYGDVQAGQLLALVGSGACLEIAIANGNAANALSISSGAPVTVRWS
jgi:S-adenosylmethionine hydrolase